MAPGVFSWSVVGNMGQYSVTPGRPRGMICGDRRSAGQCGASYVTTNIERLSRAVALVGVVAIIGLSVTPGTLRPQTGVSGYVEHLSAYILLGLVLALGWALQLRRIMAVLFTFALGSVIEVLQLWIPGRTGDAVSAIVSGTGGLIGVLIIVAYERTLGRMN